MNSKEVIPEPSRKQFEDIFESNALLKYLILIIFGNELVYPLPYDVVMIRSSQVMTVVTVQTLHGIKLSHSRDSDILKSSRPVDKT